MIKDYGREYKKAEDQSLPLNIGEGLRSPDTSDKTLLGAFAYLFRLRDAAKDMVSIEDAKQRSVMYQDIVKYVDLIKEQLHMFDESARFGGEEPKLDIEEESNK